MLPDMLIQKGIFMNFFQSMSSRMRIILSLAGISLVIIVHEMGHWLACVIAGVLTPTFSIGFGPSLFGIHIGKTFFQIALLPLGGYVEISPTDFDVQPYLIQLMIVLAGIVFNILFAFIIFTFIALRSTHKAVSIIGEIEPNSPAANTSLQPGDHLISLNETVITDQPHFAQFVMKNPGKTIQLTINRNHHEYQIPLTIASTHPLFGDNVGWVGIQWQTISEKKPSLFTALHNGFLGISQSASGLGEFINTLSSKSESALIGPIGIINLTSKSITFGLSTFLFMLALLSMNIAFFNLLPVPFFDGGKLVLITLQALFGHIPTVLINIINIVFLFLILYLFMKITAGDIKRIRQ
jgi:regulator of sigma E protease